MCEKKKGGVQKKKAKAEKEEAAPAPSKKVESIPLKLADPVRSLKLEGKPDVPPPLPVAPPAAAPPLSIFSGETVART